MSATKRLFLTCAAAILAVGLSARTSEAQYYRVHVGVGVPYFGAGFYWGGPFYDPWYGFAPCCGYPPPYPGPYLPPDASLKLEVKPNAAEVYVDGYYAGIVDDFDGAFQRLHVPPGEHEIELYLQGYKTVKQKVMLAANNTFKVKYTMVKLAAGEVAEPRPEPPPSPPQGPGGPPPYPPQGQAGQPPYPPQEPMPPLPQRSPTRRPPPPPPQGGNVRAGQSGFGSISIRVQPADAEVSIDGEAWRSPAGQDRLIVELPEGSHTVEIRKSGFRTYVTQIDVRRGETTPLNVSLHGEQ